MDKTLKNIDLYLSKIISFICIFCTSSLAILVITSVFLRYVFSITYVWAEELITFLFIATTYFGVILGVRENEHISVCFLLEKLNENGKRISKILIGIIVIIVQIVIIKTSFIWIGKVGNVLSPGLRIPNKFIYFMLPISCFLVIVYELIKIIRFTIGERDI